MSINFKEETIRELEKHGYTVNDINWIGTSKTRLSIVNFFKIADFEYDDGYGAAEIPTNLKIVGDNWWLERHDYDGAEWWEFKTMPSKAGISNEVYLDELPLGMWDTLEDLLLKRGQR